MLDWGLYFIIIIYFKWESLMTYDQTEVTIILKTYSVFNPEGSKTLDSKFRSLIFDIKILDQFL